MNDKETTFEQWRELNAQLDAFLHDALWLAGQKHLLMVYADSKEDISDETAADTLRGIRELLSDLEHDSFPAIREKLRAYGKATGLKLQSKRRKADEESR